MVPMVVPIFRLGTTVAEKHIPKDLALPYWFPTLVPIFRSGTTVAKSSKLEKVGNHREPVWGTTVVRPIFSLKTRRWRPRT